MIEHPNILPLKTALAAAEQAGYALGAFAPRYTPMIEPILRAGEQTRSPLIVQISEKELARYGIEPAEFAAVLSEAIDRAGITVPVVLHLDHTKQLGVIEAAIAAGFSSVMIDASELPLESNIAVTRAVVEYAHSRGVSVEAELGMIGTTDFVETDRDEELYTDPHEARRFVRETGVDALAVSVGTAHGVYNVRRPRIDYARLRAIRELTPVPLVLHGGSGVPAAMIEQAIGLPGGGISKVNIATDLELAMLGALHRSERMTDRECRSLPAEQLALARAAVEATVIDKMCNFVRSAGHASQAPGGKHS